MKYRELISINREISIIQLLKFLGELKNASMRPAGSDEYDMLTLPPLVYWWYESIAEEEMQFIVHSVNNFGWRDEWILREINTKHNLHPKKILEIQNRYNLESFEHACVWLKRNEPELGVRANEDLKLFTKFFRGRLEQYLKKKECCIYR